MTKVTVKAISSFAHGNIIAHAGEAVTINKGEADELRKAGLVGEETAEEDSTQEQVTPAPEEHQQGDVVTDNPETGDPDVKSAEPLENKMEEAPANKGRKGKKAE